jgi:hypothetical protein
LPAGDRARLACSQSQRDTAKSILEGTQAPASASLVRSRSQYDTTTRILEGTKATASAAAVDCPSQLAHDWMAKGTDWWRGVATPGWQQIIARVMRLRIQLATRVAACCRCRCPRRAAHGGWRKGAPARDHDLLGVETHNDEVVQVRAGRAPPPTPSKSLTPSELFYVSCFSCVDFHVMLCKNRHVCPHAVCPVPQAPSDGFASAWCLEYVHETEPEPCIHRVAPKDCSEWRL